MSDGTYKWLEMSYYRLKKEKNETLSQRLRNENKDCYSPTDYINFNYRDFEEDDYSEESEA